MRGIGVRFLIGCVVLAWARPGDAAVVINEIFYHAPNDLEGLSYIELFNPGDQAVNLAGWKLAKGIQYQFLPDAKIEAKGFVVLCQNPERFKQFYGLSAHGTFAQALSKKGERIELLDAQGQRIDSVKYQDHAPWPAAPDGHSASLERISPAAESDLPQNWVGSPLAEDAAKPNGTPGRQNASYSANLPPIIKKVSFTPAQPSPEQTIQVEANVQDSDGLREVNLRYRTAASGSETHESILPMNKTSKHLYTARIPGQKSGQLVRFRIEAHDAKGARRLFPAESEPRPALSCYVHEPFPPGHIPQGLIINVGEAELKAAQAGRSSQRNGMMTEEDRSRLMARYMLENGLDLEGPWFQLGLNQQLSLAQLKQLEPVFRSKLSERSNLIARAESAASPQETIKAVPKLIQTFETELAQALRPQLNETQNKDFAEWQGNRKSPIVGDPFRGGPEPILRQLFSLESYFFKASQLAGLDESRLAALRTVYQTAWQKRQSLAPSTQAAMNGDGNWQEVQEKTGAAKEQLMTHQKAVLTKEQDQEFAQWRRNRRGAGPRRESSARAPTFSPQGRSAFVYVAPQTGAAELFDFVHIRPRSGGFKVHFLKDRTLHGLAAINLIFEGHDRFILAEPLAYEVYRKAGNAAPLTDFVRLSVDGESIGYHLLIEQPNRAFLRRNKINDEGNLYKILWFEQGVTGQHERKTHPEGDHADLLDLLSQLEKSQGDAQWAVIKKHFNLEQVINYFAVNMCLSHWDGFFNNYLTYHDTEGSGRWEIYPWDQDKTWGFHDGLGEGELFYDMPLTFGMEGDLPPGWPKGRPAPRGMMDGNTPWWRPGGYFSKPLLANPSFRKQFLARTKELLETVYTRDVFFPIIDAMGERLRDEVRVRATALKEDPEKASQRLQQNLQSLRDHLVKRREFLLQQPEIRSAGKFSPGELK